MSKEVGFLNGEDLKQFMLFLHNYAYDHDWAKRFREQHPEFSHDKPILFQIAGELNGKNILSFRKSSSVLTKAGILFRPIGHCADAEMGQPLPYLYFPFTDRAEYWGETKSKHYPDVEYPYLRITGVEIQ